MNNSQLRIPRNRHTTQGIIVRINEQLGYLVVWSRQFNVSFVNIARIPRENRNFQSTTWFEFDVIDEPSYDAPEGIQTEAVNLRVPEVSEDPSTPRELVMNGTVSLDDSRRFRCKLIRGPGWEKQTLTYNDIYQLAPPNHGAHRLTTPDMALLGDGYLEFARISQGDYQKLRRAGLGTAEFMAIITLDLTSGLRYPWKLTGVKVLLKEYTVDDYVEHRNSYLRSVDAPWNSRSDFNADETEDDEPPPRHSTVYYERATQRNLQVRQSDQYKAAMRSNVIETVVRPESSVAALIPPITPFSFGAPIVPVPPRSLPLLQAQSRGAAGSFLPPDAQPRYGFGQQRAFEPQTQPRFCPALKSTTFTGIVVAASNEKGWQVFTKNVDFYLSLDIKLPLCIGRWYNLTYQWEESAVSLAWPPRTVIHYDQIKGYEKGPAVQPEGLHTRVVPSSVAPDYNGQVIIAASVNVHTAMDEEDPQRSLAEPFRKLYAPFLSEVFDTEKLLDMDLVSQDQTVVELFPKHTGWNVVRVHGPPQLVDIRNLVDSIVPPHIKSLEEFHEYEKQERTRLDELERGRLEMERMAEEKRQAAELRRLQEEEIKLKKKRELEKLEKEKEMRTAYLREQREKLEWEKELKRREREQREASDVTASTDTADSLGQTAGSTSTADDRENESGGVGDSGSNSNASADSAEVLRERERQREMELERQKRIAEVERAKKAEKERREQQYNDDLASQAAQFKEREKRNRQKRQAETDKQLALSRIRKEREAEALESSRQHVIEQRRLEREAEARAHVNNRQEPQAQVESTSIATMAEQVKPVAREIRRPRMVPETVALPTPVPQLLQRRQVAAVNDTVIGIKQNPHFLVGSRVEAGLSDHRANDFSNAVVSAKREEEEPIVPAAPPPIRSLRDDAIPGDDYPHKRRNRTMSEDSDLHWDSLDSEQYIEETEDDVPYAAGVIVSVCKRCVVLYVPLRDCYKVVVPMELITDSQFAKEGCLLQPGEWMFLPRLQQRLEVFDLSKLDNKDDEEPYPLPPFTHRAVEPPLPYNIHEQRPDWMQRFHHGVLEIFVTCDLSLKGSVKRIPCISGIYYLLQCQYDIPVMVPEERIASIFEGCEKYHLNAPFSIRFWATRLQAVDMRVPLRLVPYNAIEKLLPDGSHELFDGQYRPVATTVAVETREATPSVSPLEDAAPAGGFNKSNIRFEGRRVKMYESEDSRASSSHASTSDVYSDSLRSDSLGEPSPSPPLDPLYRVDGPAVPPSPNTPSQQQTNRTLLASRQGANASIRSVLTVDEVDEFLSAIRLTDPSVAAAIANAGLSREASLVGRWSRQQMQLLLDETAADQE